MRSAISSSGSNRQCRGRGRARPRRGPTPRTAHAQPLTLLLLNAATWETEANRIAILTHLTQTHACDLPLLYHPLLRIRKAWGTTWHAMQRVQLELQLRNAGVEALLAPALPDPPHAQQLAALLNAQQREQAVCILTLPRLPGSPFRSEIKHEYNQTPWTVTPPFSFLGKNIIAEGEYRLRAAGTHPPFSFPRKKTGGVFRQRRHLQISSLKV